MALSEAGNELFTGGIDNDIKVWDLRKRAVTYTLLGHTDTVTSLQLSPDNLTLLSNSHDSTVRTWDVRPFAPADRRLQTYDGAPTGQERNLLKASWDPKGEKIAAGSGDQSVAVWDVRTGKMLNKLPGHRGAVNDVRFSPQDESICEYKFPLFNFLLGPAWKKPCGSSRTFKIQSFCAQWRHLPSHTHLSRIPRLQPAGSRKCCRSGSDFFHATVSITLRCVE